MNLRIHLRIAALAISLAGCGDPEQRIPGERYGARNLSREFPHLVDVREKWNSCELLNLSAAGSLTPAFTLLYGDLLQVPDAACGIGNSLVSDCRHPETLLYHCFRLLGVPAGGFGPPLSGIRKSGRDVACIIPEGSIPSWEMLPDDFKSAILKYLQGWMEAEEVLQQFLSPLNTSLNQTGTDHTDAYRNRLTEPWRERSLSGFGHLDLTGKADLRKLSYASRLLASSLAALTGYAEEDFPEDFRSCVLETSLGEVKIFGGKSDTIQYGSGLVIDLGGDDLYLGNIASPVSPDQCISAIIDIAGDDTYRSEKGYLVNGSLGIGMLFDLSGDDLYEADQAGPASSCYGTSMLYDRSGDDRYVSRSAYSQGAAHLGAALLVDLEGDDLYCSSGESQGYGGTLGVGILLDMGGNDRYNVGNDSVSFVQGAGRGRWAEASDGHSLGGGIGIFVDGGGSDQYQAGSFSQGASYFTGIGFFMELEGDDRYMARSHSQGYAAHFGLAGFFELRGDDHYNEGSDYLRLSQLLGSGRDLSAGWFIDEAGDDCYHFGNRSAGIGDLNGVGILWDRKGHDTYTWHQNGVNANTPSMGQTIALSRGMSTGSRLLTYPPFRCTGIFRDKHGSRRMSKKYP